MIIVKAMVCITVSCMKFIQALQPPGSPVCLDLFDECPEIATVSNCENGNYGQYKVGNACCKCVWICRHVCQRVHRPAMNMSLHMPLNLSMHMSIHMSLHMPMHRYTHMSMLCSGHRL